MNFFIINISRVRKAGDEILFRDPFRGCEVCRILIIVPQLRIHIAK